MKLQACSKVIMLAALGFTLTAAGAFYSLLNAENSVASVQEQALAVKLQSVHNDISHYVQRINSDYYGLINQSLSNILSLDARYFERDPLLSFFATNIRTQSAYQEGDQLRYALDALNYFKIPFLSYDFNTHELQVHTGNQVFATRDDNITVIVDSLKDEISNSGSRTNEQVAFAQQLLKIRSQDGVHVSQLISVKPTLPHSFSIFYSGADTYLCLKIYDPKKNINYFVLDSYLSVLENIKLDVKNVFSDIDPMMKGVLGEDAVIIVRRNEPIFKSGNFTLDLDLNKIKFRDLVGTRLVDHKGNTISDQSKIATLAKEGQVSILATAYLRSINSYLIMQRPFSDVSHGGESHFLSKLLIILCALGFLSLITYQVFSDMKLVNQKREARSKIVEKFKSLTLEEFRERYLAARNKLIAPPKPQESLNNTAVETKDVDMPAAPADAASNALDSEANTKSPAEQSSESTNSTVEPADAATTLADKEEPKDEADTSKPAEENSEPSDTLDGNEEVASNDSSKDNEVVEPLVDDVLLQMIKDYLAEKDLSISSLDASLLVNSFKLTKEIEQELSAHIESIKEDFKNRIPLYIKEGQCKASRQMLFSALPSEDAMPSSNFVDFAAVTVPARDLTGNFYAIERLDEDNLAFVIGDCEATGTKAAYTVAVVNTLVSEALRQDMSPTEVMYYLDQRLKQLKNISPVSLFVGMISEKTGNVIAANAGHCVPVVIDNTGPHFVAQFNNRRLGVPDQQDEAKLKEISSLGVRHLKKTESSEQDFELIKWYLANDDMVLLYTDGILNVKNNQDESFGITRLFEHCESANSLRADELVINILNDLKIHKGKRPFKQDVSLICLKQLRIRF